VTATTRTFLFCDGRYPDGEKCQATLGYSTVPDARTHAEARAEARKQGWHRTRGSRDICPGCWGGGTAVIPMLLVLAAGALLGYLTGRVRPGVLLYDWALNAVCRGWRSPTAWAAAPVALAALAWVWAVHPRRTLANLRTWRAGPPARSPGVQVPGPPQPAAGPGPMRVMLGAATLLVPADTAAQWDRDGWPDDGLVLEIADRLGWHEDGPR
jgi:hypothetical protein